MIYRQAVQSGLASIAQHYIEILFSLPAKIRYIVTDTGDVIFNFANDVSVLSCHILRFANIIFKIIQFKWRIRSLGKICFSLTCGSYFKFKELLIPKR
jgi:hypothetical protein